MPIYAYRCSHCGHAQDVLQKMSDVPLTHCPECGQETYVKQLTAAGFNVKQVVREYSQIESDALAGKFDAFILSRATVLDSGDPVAYMYSDFACKGSFNIAQLCRPEIDQALQKAAAIPAGNARREAIMQAENLILSTDAAIPMLHERVIQGEAADIRDAVRDPRERTLINAATQRVEETD